MPTAQSTTSVPSQKKNTKVDNKIAKAVAKVEQSENVVPEQQQQSNPTGTTGNKTPQEQPEFIKQSLIIIEKKVRNLEKRRAKLDEYKASKTPLNEDQLLAVSKYEEVVRSMELARELEKQFIALANDAMKQQKKQSKKEQLEREEFIKERLKEAHKYNSVLTTFGDETVRNDFLNETNGATKLSQQELNLLDEFSKLVEPAELGNRLDTASSEVADHLLYAIEGRNKPITSLNQEQTGLVTYSDLKKLFERILTSSYWTRETQQVEQTQEQPESEQIEQNEENLSEQVNNLNLNEQQVEQQQQQQQVYHQNTSDDYVLVNTSDYHPENTQQQQQQPLQQQQQQSKAYFTTLNPSTNINEFLQNNNEGINFLQDSEIQLQQEQPEQTQQQSQQTQSQQPQHHQSGNFQGEQNRENRGGRGGHREYNGNRNYDQRRNYEQRRSGGGNYQPRGDRGENNGPRNGSGGGGYRGGRGGYRGGYSNSGPRSGSGGNQYPRQPREHQQQPVA